MKVKAEMGVMSLQAKGMLRIVGSTRNKRKEWNRCSSEPSEVAQHCGPPDFGLLASRMMRESTVASGKPNL